MIFLYGGCADGIPVAMTNSEEIQKVSGLFFFSYQQHTITNSQKMEQYVAFLFDRCVEVPLRQHRLT